MQLPHEAEVGAEPGARRAPFRDPEVGVHLLQHGEAAGGQAVRREVEGRGGNLGARLAEGQPHHPPPPAPRGVEPGHDGVLARRARPRQGAGLGEAPERRDLLDRQPLAQALDQGRGGERLAVVVRGLPGEGHRRGRRQELGEEVALLVEPRALDRHVRQHPLEDAAQVVRQQRVLADAAREDVAVEPHQEEVLEGARAGLGDREHLDAPSPSPDRGGAHGHQQVLDQEPHLVALQPEARGDLPLQLLQGGAHRRALLGVEVPAEVRLEQGPQAGEVLGGRRLLGPAGEAVAGAARGAHGGADQRPLDAAAAGVRLVAPHAVPLLRPVLFLAGRRQPLADRQGVGPLAQDVLQAELGGVPQPPGAERGEGEPEVHPAAPPALREGRRVRLLGEVRHRVEPAVGGYGLAVAEELQEGPGAAAGRLQPAPLAQSPRTGCPAGRSAGAGGSGRDRDRAPPRRSPPGAPPRRGGRAPGRRSPAPRPRRRSPRRPRAGGRGSPRPGPPAPPSRSARRNGR